MRENIIYNRPTNEVMVRTSGNFIYIICNKEEQVQPVMDKMTNNTCYLSDYEEWDDDEDMRWILTFKILDEFDIKPKLN
jgi:hypothetical protein|tara:strand:+ start:355 stop:591 length:237 start_codon:yes stop_codon:yes gene_type:complete